MSDNIKLGSKVEILGKGLFGVVSYFGVTSFASGKWIGVTLNKPLGRNDGEVQGKRYFTCDPNCGVFVRPTQVQVVESPSLTRKADRQSVTAGSGLPNPNRGERSSQSRLATPSSLQKPKTRLSFAPKTPQEPVHVKPTTQESAPNEPTSQFSAAQSKPAPVQSTEPAADELKMPQIAAPTVEPTPISNLSTFAPGVSMVEIESLKGQIKEWKEKYETIRIKRQEDRSKLKDVEKMKIQLQQLQDTKARYSEQVQDLSKQLRDAKKGRDEAVDDKNRYVDEMSDVHETIEMATLDKEMAEEKADILQKEVHTLNERVDELQTDLEIIKAEMDDQGSDGAANSYQVKQLTEQNNKLKEALVRLRDLSAAEKSEYQSLEKQLEKRSKELNEVTQKKEKLQKQLEVAESITDELKEQVDASLIAEELVESLTEKNLEQEEKIVDMLEQIHDLESMNDMNEELQENARETELELREEVDLMRAKTLEAKRQTEAANEVVADYQDTIQKFRKVVQDLQESNQELRSAQSEKEEKGDNETAETQPPVFNYQIKMVETKAAARSIDHELRKLELNQANLLVNFLKMYLPTSIEKGGDNDCIQVLLLVKRFSSKAQIIAKHIIDKFDLSTEVEQNADFLGVRGNQLTFGTALVVKLTDLHILMDSYAEALNKCSVDLLLKIGTLYREMLSYEQVLNVLTDMLRKDTLDETTNIDTLDKLVQFFRHLYNVHLSRDKSSCYIEMDQYLNSAQALNNATSANTQRLKAFLQPGSETSDVAILLKDLATSCGDVKQFCKKIRRRMGQPSSDGKSKRLDYPNQVRESMQQSVAKLQSVHSVVMHWARYCVRINRPTDSSALPSSKMNELLKKTSTEVLQGADAPSSLRASLADVTKVMNSLQTSMQEGDYDSAEPLPLYQAPIEKRSQVLKSEMVDSEGLNSKIEEREVVIMDLKKMFKLKNDDLAESKIRIGMLERKLEKAVKEGNEKASLLQQKLDSLTEDLKKKEKEYDETLDALQNDIDSLETEKANLKQRLSSVSKKSVIADLGFKSPGGGGVGHGLKSDIASVLTNAADPLKVADSPLLTHQINVLRTALRSKGNECSKLAGEKMIRQLQCLTPLRNNKTIPNTTEVKDVQRNLSDLSSSLSDMVLPKLVDVSKRNAGRYPVGSGTPYQILLDQQWKLRVLNEELINISVKAQQAIARSRKLEVQGDFASFPVPPLAKSLSLGEPHLIGKLNMNMEGSNRSSSPGHKLYLEIDQLNKLHDTIKRSVHLL